MFKTSIRKEVDKVLNAKCEVAQQRFNYTIAELKKERKAKRKAAWKQFLVLLGLADYDYETSRKTSIQNLVSEILTPNNSNNSATPN